MPLHGVNALFAVLLGSWTRENTSHIIIFVLSNNKWLWWVGEGLFHVNGGGFFSPPDLKGQGLNSVLLASEDGDQGNECRPQTIFPSSYFFSMRKRIRSGFFWGGFWAIDRWNER